VQFEPFRAGDADIFLEPLLMAVELRGGGAGAVGDQGEQGPLQVESEAPAGGLPLKDGADAEAIPDRFQGVHIAVGPGAVQAPRAPGSNDLLRRTAPQNAFGQAPQALGGVGIIGATAVVDDLGLRTPLVGVPDVLRQLQVGDDAAVCPPLFALS